ncbi:MAG: periplasmic heavy metal sensor [Candidatus Aminicenantes bacterium]|nr:periplasmic heavy metal sensor [Candidatus Aminicenantes bacterium]
MKRRILPILLVISLGVNIGFLLHWIRPRLASGREAGAASLRGGAAAAGWHAGPMRRHLGLDAGQARRMERERRQVLAQVEPLQEEMRRQRRALFVLIKGGAVRDADLDATLGEIARLQAAIEKKFVLHSLKVRSAFSSEQLRKYDGCLERGLCAGISAGESCPAQREDRRGARRACASEESTGKRFGKANKNKEVLPDDTKKNL